MESGGCIGKNTPEPTANALALNQLTCLQNMLRNDVDVPAGLRLKLKGLLSILSNKNDTKSFESTEDGEEIDEFDVKAMEESSVALKARSIFRSLPY